MYYLIIDIMMMVNAKTPKTKKELISELEEIKMDIDMIVFALKGDNNPTLTKFSEHVALFDPRDRLDEILNRITENFGDEIV